MIRTAKQTLKKYQEDKDKRKVLNLERTILPKNRAMNIA
jgi:hypothetical protein